MQNIEVIHLEDDINDQLLLYRSVRKMKDLGYHINLHFSMTINDGLISYSNAVEKVNQNKEKGLSVQEAPLIVADFDLPENTNSLEFITRINTNAIDNSISPSYALLLTGRRFEEFPSDKQANIKKSYFATFQKGSDFNNVASALVRAYQDIYEFKRINQNEKNIIFPSFMYIKALSPSLSKFIPKQ